MYFVGSILIGCIFGVVTGILFETSLVASLSIALVTAVVATIVASIPGFVEERQQWANMVEFSKGIQDSAPNQPD